MTMEQLKALSAANGGPLYRDVEGPYQVWGPIIVPTRLVWSARFSGKAGGEGMYAHCKVSVTSNANPVKRVLWTDEDRNFDHYNLTSDALSEANRTVVVGPMGTATLEFEVQNERADTEVSFFRVSVWPIWA